MPVYDGQMPSPNCLHVASSYLLKYVVLLDQAGPHHQLLQ